VAEVALFDLPVIPSFVVQVAAEIVIKDLGVRAKGLEHVFVVHRSSPPFSISQNSLHLSFTKSITRLE
jgi:hypothetical protein